MKRKYFKTMQNPYGLIDVYEEENLLVKPNILCIVPERRNLINLNGYLNKIMYLLQIRKSGDIDSNYDIRDIPFSILIRTQNDDITSQILSNIPNNDLNVAKKIFRNLNIVSYCAGHRSTGAIMNNIYDALINKGFSDSEAREILKQVFVLQIVDNYGEEQNYKPIPYATTFVVHNIFDDENMSYVNSEDSFKEKNACIKFIKTSDKTLTILYKAFGKGSLKEEFGREHNFANDYIYSPILNSIMGIILINAISSSIKEQNLHVNNLLKGLRSILETSLDYINKKNKSISSYTKEDLEDLNKYITHEIQEYFIRMIPCKKLNNLEKENLENRDVQIKKFQTLNRYTLSSYSMKDLENRIRNVMYYYDNYNDDDLIYYGHSQEKVYDIIIGEIFYIKDIIKFMQASFDFIKMPDGIDENLIREYKEFYATFKEVINNPKLIKIIDEYEEKKHSKRN